MSVTEQHIPAVGIPELRALQRQLHCATQAEFAAYLGVTQAYVSDLLTGKKTLKPGPLLKLIERLRQH